MSAFARKVSAMTGVPEEGLKRLAGGDLSEVLLFRRQDGRRTIAKGGPATSTEAAMLRVIADTGVATPAVEGEHGDILLLEYLENDGVFSPLAWANIGAEVRALHSRARERYGWSTDYALGSVALNNRWAEDWPVFWGEQRLMATARVLDRPWRERIERVATRLSELIPARPPAALLHGDLWSGNILVAGGKLAALVDPACYYGHNEIDLAMLTLFGAPPPEFWESYGELDPGWEERRPIYQLFPALVHLRLFGGGYGGMVERILDEIGV